MLLKPWRVDSDVPDILRTLDRHCTGDHTHGECRGRSARLSAKYSDKMVAAIHHAWKAYAVATKQNPNKNPKAMCAKSFPSDDCITSLYPSSSLAPTAFHGQFGSASVYNEAVWLGCLPPLTCVHPPTSAAMSSSGSASSRGDTPTPKEQSGGKKGANKVPTQVPAGGRTPQGLGLPGPVRRFDKY